MLEYLLGPGKWDINMEGASRSSSGEKIGFQEPCTHPTALRKQPLFSASGSRTYDLVHFDVYEEMKEASALSGCLSLIAAAAVSGVAGA